MSVPPPPPQIGTPSSASSTNPIRTHSAPPAEEKLEEDLRDRGLLRKYLARIDGLGSLVSWESIRRGMRREDDLLHAVNVAQFQRACGATAPTAPTPAEDDMGDLILGDRVTNTTTTQPPPRGSLLGPALAIGAGLVGGAGLLQAPAILQALTPASAMTAPEGKFRETAPILRPGKPEIDARKGE